ncbi:MAG TPA: hypothetical protein PLP42_05430 [Acidobacteriota bacterium]|nr:hypothetical protein [Acidobacteriota bacterium]
MKDTQATPARQRKPYSEPILTEVPLRPEEAVLGNCKVNQLNGPHQSVCSDKVNCITIAS